MERIEEERLTGRSCWELDTKRLKKNVWKLTKKKRERLKGVYIGVRRR